MRQGPAWRRHVATHTSLLKRHLVRDGKTRVGSEGWRDRKCALSSCHMPSFPWLSLRVSLTTGLIFPCFLAPGRKVKVLILLSRSCHCFSSLLQTSTFVETYVPCFVVVHWPLSFSLETQVPARGVAFLPYSCPISGWPHKLPGCPSQCPRPPSSSSQWALFMYACCWPPPEPHYPHSKPPLKSDHPLSPVQLSFLTLLIGHDTQFSHRLTFPSEILGIIP